MNKIPIEKATSSKGAIISRKNSIRITLSWRDSLAHIQRRTGTVASVEQVME